MDNDNKMLTAEEKKKKLYDDQVELLNIFFEKHAITQAQYDKSFHDLTIKMGMDKK